MGVDLYRVLGVDKNATDDDLKKAYTKLAMIWHPDKNPNNKKEAEAIFNWIVSKITLAKKELQVLSDPQKKAVYDQYGEEGLKSGAGVPPPGGPGGGTTIFSTGNGPTSFRFHSRSPDDIFAEFFGFSSPFGAAGGNGGMRGSRFASSMFGGPRKAAPFETKLACSLEELYEGTTKTWKIKREILDKSGKTITVEEFVPLEVKAGWKKGTKATFRDKGNEQPGIIPADLVFVIDKRLHNVFARDDNDLITTQKISLVEALTGCIIHITTLDGRSLTIPINTVIQPNYEEVVPREGMPIAPKEEKPISKGEGGRGNLRIKFDIKFPSCLTSEQKSGIRRSLQ